MLVPTRCPSMTLMLVMLTATAAWAAVGDVVDTGYSDTTMVPTAITSNGR